MTIWRTPKRVMKPFEYLRIVHKNNAVEIKIAILTGKISLNMDRVVNRKTFAESYLEMCAIVAERIEYRVVPKHWEDCRPNWSDVLKQLKITEVTKLSAPELFVGKMKDHEFQYVTTEVEELA